MVRARAAALPRATGFDCDGAIAGGGGGEFAGRTDHGRAGAIIGWEIWKVVVVVVAVLRLECAAEPGTIGRVDGDGDRGGMVKCREGREVLSAVLWNRDVVGSSNYCGWKPKTARSGLTARFPEDSLDCGLWFVVSW